MLTFLEADIKNENFDRELVKRKDPRRLTTDILKNKETFLRNAIASTAKTKVSAKKENRPQRSTTKPTARDMILPRIIQRQSATTKPSRGKIAAHKPTIHKQDG